jgi:hypothetical protein
MENRVLDVPYGDHFYQLEKWVIVAVNPDDTKIIIR